MQHVQKMRRNASRFREHALSPPPIVVTEIGSHTTVSGRVIPRPRNAMTLPSSPRPPLASAGPLTASLNKPIPARNVGYLHPFSAFERRFSFTGAMERMHQRSCPSSPIARMASDGVRGRTPALQLDTRCHDIAYNYIEIAMEVAEETARICDSPLPIPTDVPLVHSGLSTQTADDLQTWLMIRFNYSGLTHGLLDERWTPECLARDIIQRSPDFAITSESSGMIPISLGSPCKTPAMSVPEEASHLASPEGPTARSTLHIVPPRRARTKKDLTIRLVPSPVNTRFPHTPLRSSTSPLPPPRSASASVRRVTKAGSLDHDAGAPEPRSGKKAGFVVGLLAMGALLSGSPSTTISFDTPPNTSAVASHLGASRSLVDLPHTPYSASGFGGGWYGVPRETPSSASHFISPDGLYTTGTGAGVPFWAT